MERPDLYNEKCCDYPEIKITVKPAGKIIIPENLADSFTIIQNICDDIFEIVPEYYYDKEPFKSFLALSKDIDSLLEKRYYNHTWDSLWFEEEPENAEIF